MRKHNGIELKNFIYKMLLKTGAAKESEEAVKKIAKN